MTAGASFVLPAEGDDFALWHMVHDDGDEEDLEAAEVEAGMAAFAGPSNGTPRLPPQKKCAGCGTSAMFTSLGISPGELLFASLGERLARGALKRNGGGALCVAGTLNHVRRMVCMQCALPFTFSPKSRTAKRGAARCVAAGKNLNAAEKSEEGTSAASGRSTKSSSLVPPTLPPQPQPPAPAPSPNPHHRVWCRLRPHAAGGISPAHPVHLSLHLPPHLPSHLH